MNLAGKRRETIGISLVLVLAGIFFVLAQETWALKIGTLEDYTNAFNGTIDEIAIWNISLDNATIYNHYQRGVGYNSSGFFTSQVFDANNSVTFNSISWTQANRYGADLQQDELNSSVALLLHFNNNTAPENASFFKDFSNYSNNATCDLTSKCPAINKTDYKFGSSLTFDGVNDYINVSDSQSLAFGNGFTVEFWAKLNALGNSVFIAQKADSGATASGFMFSLGTATAGRIDFRVSNSSNQVVIVGSNVSINRWYHFAATFLQGNLSIYVDGTLVNRTNATLLGVIDSDQFLAIGARGDAQPFNGTLDEVAIWNISFSDDEIRKHYERGVLSLNLSYRTSADNVTWGVWTYLANSTLTILDIATRFFQYRADFNTTNALFTPFLQNITINFTGVSNLTIQSFSDLSTGFRLAIILKPINFTANYTDNSKNPINGSGIYCTFSENSSGIWSTPANMSFSSNDKIYYYNKTFYNSTQSYYNITCNGSINNYPVLGVVDFYNISNAVYRSFNGSTTNFNTIANIRNITNATLENTTTGKIVWINNVSAAGVDFDSFVTFSNNLLLIDILNLDISLNSSANITFYNVNISRPRILRDRIECTTCTLLQNSGINITFNTTSIGNFTIENIVYVSITTPSEGTTVDRDRRSSDLDNLTLLGILENSTVGINITFKANLTAPNITNQIDITLGNVTSNSLGKGNISWNGSRINGTLMYSGNYTLWAEAPGYAINNTLSVYNYGSLNLTFRLATQNPNATYKYNEIVQVDVLLDSYGPESRTNLNNTYNAKVNTTFSAGGINTSIPLNRS